MREILLGAVGVLAFALILSVSTCRWERGKHDDTRDALAASKGQVSACATSLAAVNRATQAEVDEAIRLARKGEEAAQAARQDAHRAAAREEAARRELQAAKREPTCADQLRVELCPAIPLL